MIVTNTVINYKLTSHVIKKRTNNKFFLLNSYFMHFVYTVFMMLRVQMETIACFRFDDGLVYHRAAGNTDAVYRSEFCLSVRLSVRRVNCDKTDEKSVQIFISYERTFSLVF